MCLDALKYVWIPEKVCIFFCYPIIVFHFMYIFSVYAWMPKKVCIFLFYLVIDLSFHVYFICLLLVISIYHVHVCSTMYREREINLRGDPCATEKSLCRSRHFVLFILVDYVAGGGYMSKSTSYDQWVVIYHDSTAFA